VVTPKDFLDLASRDAVDQALTRLVKRRSLLRIGRGLYHLPRVNKQLGIDVPPDLDVVAQAIGRQTGSRIAPSHAVVANSVGLTTQVPAKPVYLTDGRTRKVRVGNHTILFKHVAGKRLLDGNQASSLVIQAILANGRDTLRKQDIDTLRQRLTLPQRRRLLRDARYRDQWVADAARHVALPVMRPSLTKSSPN